MSDKPRVYQGVRVKTTVKELLQRHRAREANRKKVKTISQACLDLQDLCASTFPSRHVDPPTAAPPADVSSCGARAAASSFPFPDSACNFQMHESVFHDIQQQFGDMMLPSNGYSGNNNHHHHNHNNNNNNNNNASHHGDASCGYGASVPPPPGFPLPWCHGLSSDADYYGLEMAPCSSPESLKLCTPVDHNSYSPQDSFSSSSSSSCYDSPTRMESAHPGFTPEPPAYQSCSLQDCYCPPRCWPGQPDGFSPPEYMAAAAAAYHNPTDYHPYACAADDGYFRRDFQMSSEMCYNVL